MFQASVVMRSLVIKAPYVYTVKSFGNSADSIAPMLQAVSHFKNLWCVIYLSPRSTLLLLLSSHSAANAFLNPSSSLTPTFLFILLAIYQLPCIVDISVTFFISFSHERLHAVFDTAISGKTLLDNQERNQIQFTSVMRHI